MAFNRNKGVSVVSALIILVLFNIVSFIINITHGITFWLGYGFATLSAILLCSVFLMLFNSKEKQEAFGKLSYVTITWMYFIVQMVLSVWQMFFYHLNYNVALILNSVLTAIYLIVILSVHSGTKVIEQKEKQTQDKVLSYKSLKTKLDLVETNDSIIEKKIEELSEMIQFGDPISHSSLHSLENEIANNLDLLCEAIENGENADQLFSIVKRQLKERDIKCKELKNVKDIPKEDNNVGVRYFGVAFGILAFMAVIILSVTFFFVPLSKYNAAQELYDLKQYEDSIKAFEQLDNFKDSKHKIELAKTAILDEKYENALSLLNNKEYEESIVAFTEINDYKDSAQKIAEATECINSNQYNLAEGFFNDGKYSEAINIYSSLGDYKDSKTKIEQIYNRLSDGDILYFGTFKGSPIAWKILKRDSEKLLLITENPIANKPFNDEIKNVSWETSSIRKWLNEDFISSFSEKQKEQIMNYGSLSDKVFLLSVDEMDQLSKDVLFKTSAEWWTRTVEDGAVMYVSTSGWIKAKGDQVVRDKGVRPSICINLN